jgi:hypothetical protein
MPSTTDELTLADYEREGRIAYHAKECARLMSLNAAKRANNHWGAMKGEMSKRSPAQILHMEASKGLR